MKLILIAFSLIISMHLSGQTTLKGIVIDENNEAVIGATVLDQSTGEGTAADDNGKFSIVITENSVLTFSAVGHAEKVISFKEINFSIPFRLVLPYESEILDQVVVTAKSQATLAREKAYAVEVIKSKGFKNLSTNANTILKRVSGVNIRESGGLGSNFTLSLNGLSGNQVRIFLNGMPMDYFGSSLSLNNFAANLIDRIEVYKGVVPVHLSSDALGGAINVITSNTVSNYLDASYSVGSFNTHIASLNAQYRLPKSGFTNRIKSFYNNSDNNYKVPVKLVDFATGKQSDEETWLPRFHDAYESKMIWYETGFTATKWADELMVGFMYSDNFKELQQPANAIGQANIPYGEVISQEKKKIGNFSYRKNGLLDGKLSLSSYAVGVFAKQESRDTASVRYDWYGNSYPKTNNTTGEIENRKTQLIIEGDNYLGNANAEYAFTSKQSITLNYSLNFFTLVGSDKYKAQNNTQFKFPSDVNKHVWAGSFTQSWIKDRLKSTIFSKYYKYKIKSLETNYSGTEIIPFENKKDQIGYGLTSTYTKNGLQLKLSYENSIRFPEVYELFGDGLNVIANPGLLPENSNNYNLGILWNKKIGGDKLQASLNTYIRDAKDFIIPFTQGIKVLHKNSGAVLSKGVDLSLGYTLNNNYIITANASYLDLRDNNKFRNGQEGVKNSLYRSRVPNVPYLFGNVNLSYRNQSLFRDHDSYSISINNSYTKGFFYKWEILGSKSKNKVPSQYSANIDAVYSMFNGKYNFSLSVVNVFDARLYDNFQQIRPGRNLNFKVRYFLN